MSRLLPGLYVDDIARALKHQTAIMHVENRLAF